MAWQEERLTRLNMYTIYALQVLYNNLSVSLIFCFFLLFCNFSFDCFFFALLYLNIDKCIIFNYSRSRYCIQKYFCSWLVFEFELRDFVSAASTKQLCQAKTFTIYNWILVMNNIAQQIKWSIPNWWWHTLREARMLVAKPVASENWFNSDIMNELLITLISI